MADDALAGGDGPGELVMNGMAWLVSRDRRVVILAQAAMAVGFDPESVLVRLVDGRFERITCEHVAKAAAQEYEFAQSLLNQAWACLAEALCHVIALLCPRRIIVGGGASLMGEKLLFEPLRRLVAQSVFKPFADAYDIVPAALGEEIVVHGALVLARRHVDEGALDPNNLGILS